MNGPIVVAQAGGPAGAGSSNKTVAITKPVNNQAITIHLDGSTKLDLTAIANESITLVHAGDRLIILFDNHAEVVIESFFGDNGQPLPDITVELGPNRDVTAAQFVSDFPVTTDLSVLPASGGPNSVSSGANFVSFTIDSLAPSSTPLALLGSEGATVATGGAGGHENLQIIPMSLTGAKIAGAADEGGLTATVDEFGIGNNPAGPTVATGVPGSLFALVNFGTGGPNGTPFQFVAPTDANAWLASLGLTSHGAAIDTATINGSTLIASTDPAEGTPHAVFSLTIDASGGWTFTLLAPIDDAAGQGTNTATIDLAGLIQAVDAAGLTITLANDFVIVVGDDVPLLTGATDTSHGVEEAALGGIAVPGDLYGGGNDPTHANGLAVASGSLASLVAFGADGPAFDSHQSTDGFQFAVADKSAHDFGLTSHGEQVDFVTLSAVTDGAGGATQTLTAWTNGGAANGGHEVFTLTLNGDGTYTFTLINPLDQAGDDTTAMTLDLSSLVEAVDFDGDVVALSGDFTITVANDVPVLTGAIAPAGTVDEGVLVQAPAGTDLFGDGNDHALAAASAVASGTLAGEVAFGADGQALTTGGLAHGFQLTVTDGTANSTLLPGITSHGQVISFYTVTAPEDGSSQTLTAWAGGGESDGGHAVFTMLLNGDGSYVFTLLSPLDEAAPGEDTTTLDLSALVKAVDFDGDAMLLAPGDFTVTVIDDVPVLTGSATSGSVDEGGLTFASAGPGDLYGGGNDHGATSAAGSLAGLVRFGADGPQSGSFTAATGSVGESTTVTATIADGFQFVSQSAANAWLASLGLSSHEQAINFATITSTTSTDGTGVTDVETLTAWTNGGPSGPGHQVFTLTLDVSTGAWTFALINPIDDLGASATLDLSGLVQAIDYDGDVLALSSGTPSATSDFTVTVAADVPVLTNSHVSGSVDEGGLRDGAHGGTDSYGSGNDDGLTIAAGGILAGSLNDDVSFGADGPALADLAGVPLIANGFQFAVTSGSTFDFGVTSHGVEVDYVTLSSQTVGLDGETQMLTAYAGQGGPAVFTLTLGGDGSWVFQLLEPLDEASQGQDATQIDLSGLIKAVDFDGDSVTLSDDFKITVTDDVPSLTAAASGTVFEAGLTAATDPYGSGTEPGAATTASGTLGLHFGADGPAVPTFATETASFDSQAVADSFDDQERANNFTGGSVGHLTFVPTGDFLAQFVDTTGVGTLRGHTIAVTDSLGPFTLSSVQLGGWLSGGSTAQILITGYDAAGDLLASATVTVPDVTFSIDPLPFVFNAAGTAFDGVQLSKLLFTDEQNVAFNSASVLLDNLVVETPTSGPTSGPVYFTDQTTAANNITVTDANGQPVDLASLTSHGQPLAFALLSPSELVAYTGALTTDHIVFTVTLSATAPNGSYDFVLDQALDQPLSGADGLKLTFSYTAQDFDGDTASGTFTVTASDDVPALTGATTSGAVDEHGLSTASGDLYGDGNDPGQGAVAASTATLPTLVDFGADGPAFDQNGGNSGFRFAVADGSTFDFGMKSHGQEVDFVTLSAVTDGTHGAEQTLTAWTNGGAGNGGHAVFTLTLDGDGNYKFTLINPLDDGGQTFKTLDLSRLIEAVDFDGDAVTLATGDFTIAVNDDTPSISGAASGSVFEAGLASATDPFGAGSHAGSASFAAEASGSLGLHFGGDGPAALGALHFTDTTTAANNVTVTDGNGAAVSLASLTSHGAAVHFTLLDAQTLVAYTGASAPTAIDSSNAVFSVTLSAAAPNGSYDFVLDQPLDQALAGADGLNLSFSYAIKDFDGGTASGSFAVTMVDDVPTADAGPAGEVFESGLTAATDPFGTGTVPGASTEASGSFGLHFGADGPAVPSLVSETVSFDDPATRAALYQSFSVQGDTAVGHIGDVVFTASSNVALVSIDPISFGAISDKTLTVSDSDGPFVLTTVDLAAFNDMASPTSDVLLTGLDAFGNVVASATVTLTDSTNGSLFVAEFVAAGTAFDGKQLAKLVIADQDTHPGAQVEVENLTIRAPAPTSGPLYFTDQTTAANNISVTDGNGQVVALSSLTSHGEALHFALSGARTLVAYTGSDATHPVFTVTLSNTATDGTYDFVLDKPLDELPGTAGALSFTFSYTARDFDGDVTPGSFTVTAHDDAPFAHTVSATLAENASATVTVTEGTDWAPGADGLLFSFIDTAGAKITSDPTNGHLVLPTGAQLTTNGNSITLDPGTDFRALGAGESATLDIPYTVEDLDQSTTTGHIVFTIHGVDQAPVITGTTSAGPIAEDLASTNLIINGGFESGLSGWTGSADLAKPGHSGFAVIVSNLGSLQDSVSQSIQTVAGQEYLLSFWAGGFATASNLLVDWNGAQAASFTVLRGNNVTFQEYFVDLIGDGSVDRLRFGTAPNGEVLLDDVSLQPILGPAVTTQGTSGTIAFSDPDVNDTHSGTFVAENGGKHPDGSDYLGTFTVGSATEAGGSGSIPWQFTVDRSAIQFLAQNQILQQFYDVTIDDGKGGSVTQKVEVDIIGTNDAPAFTGGATSGSVDEIGLAAGTTPVTGSNTHDTTSGVVTFADPDFTDTGHTTSTTYVAGSAAWSGGDASAIPAQTLADLATAMTAQATAESTSGSTGNVKWTVSLPDHDLDFLAQGETLNATFDLTISDQNGGRASEPVTVTFNGANDEPFFTGAAGYANVVEDAGDSLIIDGGFENGLSGWNFLAGVQTTGAEHSGTSAALLLSSSLNTAGISQGVQTVAGQEYALTFWFNGPGTGTLNVSWDGSQIASISGDTGGIYKEFVFDVLGDGTRQSLGLSFVAPQRGSIPATIDDVSLQPLLEATPTTQTTSGTIAFSDPDVNDTHSGTFVAENGGKHTDGSDYLGTFTVGSATEAGGTGGIPWQFSADRAGIQFLAQGQVLQQFYDVTIVDGKGGSITQSVEVDITGTNDAPGIAPADKSESASLQVGGGTETASGAIRFTDVDLTDRPAGSASPASITYTDANGQDITQTLTQAQINAIEGAFSVSQGAGNTNDGEIDWSFSLADSQLAFLTRGQSVTLTETVTVDDHNGGTDTSNVTVTLSGPNHPPVFTSAPESALIIEGQSLRPPANLVTNGNFESDTTTGWGFSNFLYDAGIGQAAHSGIRAVDVATSGSNLGTMSQTITDQAGLHYKIDLWAVPTGGSTGNSLQIQWNGATVQAWSNIASIASTNPSNSSQYVEYTADVVGTGSDLLGIVLHTSYYWFLDDISVAAAVTPGTESAAGAITFKDDDHADTHTITVTPDGAGYVGALNWTSVDSTGSGNGSINWTYSVADSALQGILAAQQTTVQTYTVSIDDHFGGVTQQTIAVELFNPDHGPAIVLGGPTAATITSNLDASAPTNQLIQDGGFEAPTNNGLGTLWTAVYQPGLGDVIEDTLTPHGGTQALFVFTGTDAPNDVIKLSQAVSGTVANVPYTLTFFVVNDSFDPNNFLNVLWNGQEVAALTAIPASGSFSNFTQYTVTLIGTGTTSTLEFDIQNPRAYAIDDVTLVANVTPGSERTGGTITFTDADVGDTHTVTVTPLGTAYVGTLTAQVTTESSGGASGLVNWVYTVPDSAIVMPPSGSLSQTYTITINDGHGGVASENVTVNINNDAPVLTPFGPVLPSFAANAASIPTETVASIVGSSINDPDSGARQGIAITGATGVSGNWQFSTDSGGHWTSFGSYATSSALLLGSNDLVRFVPDGTNSGSDDTFSYVAWDQTSGTDGGTANVTVRGGTSAFSTASDTAHLTVAGNRAPVITSAPPVVAVFEDNAASSAPSILLNGGFEAGSSPWAFNGGSVDITNSPAHSGSAVLEMGTSGGDGTASQTFATVVGQTYTVDFWLRTDSFTSSPNDFSAKFGNTVLFSVVNASRSTTYTEHTVNVVATSTSTTLTIAARNDPGFWYVDDVSVKPAATATSGALTFTDPDTTDTHTVSVTPAAGGYFGSLTAAVAADSTGGGTGTVNWTYTPNNAAIQFLGAGQSLTQTYAVTVNDGLGGTTSQNVTVTLYGVNDAPVLNPAQTVALNSEAVSAASANKVSNGGFEGSLSGWTFTAGTIVDSGTAHHGGSFSAATNNTSTDTLSQTITTVANQQYLVDYFVSSNGTTLTRTASSSWNGTQIASVSNLGATFVEQMALVTATGTNSTLSFSLRDSVSGKQVFLDDISVTPVPAGAGTLVSWLVGNGAGPSNVSDADSGAPAGIAITAVSSTVSGLWLYSTNGGATWNVFPTVSTANALLLAANSSTLIYFMEPAGGAAGSGSITFNAWDQSTGTNGGTANVNTNGGTTAFSAVSETATVALGNATAGPFALTSGTDSVFYAAGTNTVTATETATLNLNSADVLIGGSGNDTLTLNLAGITSAYAFNFATMTGKFTGFDTVALSGQTPPQAVSLTFGNANVLSGQTLTVDGHADTGQSFTVNGAAITDAGSLNIIAARDALNALTGGSGNDTFRFASANFASTDSVAGNAGIDMIQFTDIASFSVSDSAFANVAGVEILTVGGGGTDTLNLGPLASAAFGGAGHTLTIDDTFGAPLVINQSGTGTTANLLIELTNAHFNASDSLTGGSGSDTIWLVDTGGLTVADAAFTNVHGIETLKVGGSGPDVITIGSAASADVGGAGQTFTVDDSAATGPLTVNAAGMTANVVIDLTSANFTSADHITGGTGSDTIALVDTTGIVVTDAAFANVTSIEALKVGGAANDSVTLGANASADVGGFGHLFTLDDSTGLGNLSLNAAAMTADLEVLAGGGNDVITGGSGNDTFFAGLGNDIFTGGLGNNTYVFNSLNLGADQITDFNNTTRTDQIQVSAAGFGGGLTPNQDVTGIFQTAANANFSGAGGGSGQFLFDTANHTLYYSANGTTGAEHAIAQIEAGVTLTPHDIHVAA